MRAIKGKGGLLCVRKLCGKTQTCGYLHNCQAMTAAEATLKQAQWDEAQRQREYLAELETSERRHESLIRRSKLKAMLEAHDLCIDDLEAFINEVQNA